MEPLSGGTSDFNARVIEEFRANGGGVGGALHDTTLILIHHIGAKSGVERVTPLVCSSQQDGDYLIVASNGGSPSHPSWYHNLTANPRVEVEVGNERFNVLAQELVGTRRAEEWQKLLAASPALVDYAAKTTRRIPVLLLTRKINCEVN
ncbi:MAG TPA: nitroreductase family deazaflavin-dependent oxidoreductase [Acidimicrobiales bacterium]